MSSSLLLFVAVMTLLVIALLLAAYYPRRMKHFWIALTLLLALDLLVLGWYSQQNQLALQKHEQWMRQLDEP